jgi:hypothetical protein
MQPDHGHGVPGRGADPVRGKGDRKLGQRQLRTAPPAGFLTQSAQRGLALRIGQARHEVNDGTAPADFGLTV